MTRLVASSVGAASWVALAGFGLAGCGSGGAGPSPPPPPPPAAVTIEKAQPSGDEQAGLPGQALPAPLRVVVRQGGAATAGRTVNWQASAGSLGAASSTSGADGVATTTVTLPNGAGTITIEASTQGASGPVTFSAYAAGQNATVLVLNNRFDPQVVAIRAGGEITFDWPAGSLQHNLIPDDGRAIPNEPAIRNGVFSVTIRFPTVGDFYYHCSVHGGTRSGMFGRIIVI